MKKGIIVLLIAVLVAGFAFAGTLKGSATISFGADLDEKTFGFVNDATWKYSFKFEFDTTKVEVADHQTELWAEIAAEASASLSVSNGKLSKGEGLTGTYTAKITKANIHVGEWTFGILNAGSAVDYAKSYYTDDDGNAINDVVKGGSKLVPGFTVSYKGWNGGFGLRGDWVDGFKVNVFAHGQTKEFKFGENEEFSLRAGAYIHYYNMELLGADPKNVGAAAKVAYAADAFSADAAVDLKMDRLGGENDFFFEAAANATYKINDNGSVGLNVYGTNNIAKVDSVDKYADGKGIKLDAKLWAKYNFDFDGTKLATEGYVEAKDALVDGREIVVYAKETLTILDGKLALAFSEKYAFAKKALTLTAKATYTAEKFTAWAGVDDFTLVFGTVGAGNPAVTALKISCGIKSTVIIENAEIGATYKGLNLAKNGESITSKGAIEAYAKIAF